MRENNSSYEAEYLELASQPGMETLWFKCFACDDSGVPSYDCECCNGRSWLPLPEAERMGALVRIALKIGFVSIHQTSAGFFASVGAPMWKVEAIPEAALTQALLAVTGQQAK